MKKFLNFLGMWALSTFSIVAIINFFFFVIHGGMDLARGDSITFYYDFQVAVIFVSGCIFGFMMFFVSLSEIFDDEEEE